MSCRFIGHGRKRETVAISSYPRSGNSFMRKLLEEWSGTITGSDSHPCRTLSASLLRCGFRGEGITDDSVWFVKSHFPERMGYVRYKADRVILIIRNPFDSILSYFHMGFTNTHNKSLSSKAFEELSALWEPFLLNEVMVWTNFYKYWFHRAAGRPYGKFGDAEVQAGVVALSPTDGEVPLLLVRYEDLQVDMEGTMDKIAAFVAERDGQPLGLQLSRSVDQRSTGSVGPGYERRQRESQPGKALRTAFTGTQVEALMRVCPDTKRIMDSVGYKIATDESMDSRSGIKLVLEALPDSEANSDSVAASSPTPLNYPYIIRKLDDRFGRKVTMLRRSLTNDDKSPFETE